MLKKNNRFLPLIYFNILIRERESEIGVANKEPN